jgi:hypothetical protein
MEYGFYAPNVYGFNSPQGLGFLSIGMNNLCLETVGISGGVIGYDTGLGIGSGDIESVPDDIFFYGFTWEYPVTTGDFSIKWGLAGTTKLPNIDGILIIMNNVKVGISEWDAGQQKYIFNNAALANDLNTKYDDGTLTPLCFSSTNLTFWIDENGEQWINEDGEVWFEKE